MSAHALACRKTDLTDFLAVLLAVFEPLFAFLLAERRSRAADIALPISPRNDGDEAAARTEDVPPEPRPVPAPVAGIPATAEPNAEVSAATAANANRSTAAESMPTATCRLTEPDILPPVATDPTDEPTSASAPEPTPEPAELFAKVSGRFRPAPVGHAGLLFRRAVSAGGRVRYAPAG